MKPCLYNMYQDYKVYKSLENCKKFRFLLKSCLKSTKLKSCKEVADKYKECLSENDIPFHIIKSNLFPKDTL